MFGLDKSFKSRDYVGDSKIDSKYKECIIDKKIDDKYNG
jgi:hypothetical protein